MRFASVMDVRLVELPEQLLDLSSSIVKSNEFDEKNKKSQMDETLFRVSKERPNDSYGFKPTSNDTHN